MYQVKITNDVHGTEIELSGDRIMVVVGTMELSPASVVDSTLNDSIHDWEQLMLEADEHAIGMSHEGEQTLFEAEGLNDDGTERSTEEST